MLPVQFATVKEKREARLPEGPILTLNSNIGGLGIRLSNGQSNKSIPHLSRWARHNAYRPAGFELNAALLE